VLWAEPARRLANQVAVRSPAIWGTPIRRVTARTRRPCIGAFSDALDVPTQRTPARAASCSGPARAELLGRDRTRVYALLRSGDLLAAQHDDTFDSGPVRVDPRASSAGWSPAVTADGR
jgi:hypothetical protein